MERRKVNTLLLYTIIICCAVSAENNRLLREDARLVEFDALGLEPPSSSNNFHDGVKRNMVTQNCSQDGIHKLGEGSEMVNGKSAKEWGTKTRNKDLSILFDSYAKDYKKNKLDNYTPNRVLAKDESFIIEREKRQNNIPAGVWGREDTQNSIEEGDLENRKSLGGIAGVREDSELSRPAGIWNREDDMKGPELPAGVWGRDMNSKNMAGVWNRAVEQGTAFKANQEAAAISPGLDSLDHVYTEENVWEKQQKSRENRRPRDNLGHNSKSTTKDTAFGVWARSAGLKLERPSRKSEGELRRSSGKQERSLDSQPQRPPGLWGRQLESIVKKAKPEASQAEEKMKLPPGILPGRREE